MECKNIIRGMLQHKENCKMHEWSQAIFQMRKVILNIYFIQAMGMKLLFMSAKNIFYKQKFNAFDNLKI